MSISQRCFSNLQVSLYIKIVVLWYMLKMVVIELEEVNTLFTVL